MCSTRWARPALPGGSSLAPTSQRTATWTIGVFLSGKITNRSPLSSLARNSEYLMVYLGGVGVQVIDVAAMAARARARMSFMAGDLVRKANDCKDKAAGPC